MSVVDLTAGDVMDASASLLNDTAQTVYTYAAQLPYLKQALQELQESYQLRNISVVELTSAVITFAAGSTEASYGGPISLPEDMVEPQQLWERPTGIDPWIPMTRREYLPHELEGVDCTQFVYFAWQNNKIIVLPSVQDNDIKIDYIRELFADVTSEFSTIAVINAKSFLSYRTAGLCAEFIERNTTSSNSLNAYAMLALDRAMGIAIKGKQVIYTRRLPFRAGYKRGGWLT